MRKTAAAVAIAALATLLAGCSDGTRENPFPAVEGKFCPGTKRGMYGQEYGSDVLLRCVKSGRMLKWRAVK